LFFRGLAGRFSDPLCDSAIRRLLVVDDAVDGSAADAVSLGDLTQAQAPAVIAEDGIAVELKWMTPDMAAFELGAPHAGAHQLSGPLLGSCVGRSGTVVTRAGPLRLAREVTTWKRS
jgi:hypothetical protein